MGMYLPNGSRIYCENPADYAKVAEKILAREPVVITVTKDGIAAERVLWDPDDHEQMQVLRSHVPPRKPKLWQRLMSQLSVRRA